MLAYNLASFVDARVSKSTPAYSVSAGTARRLSVGGFLRRLEVIYAMS